MPVAGVAQTRSAAVVFTADSNVCLEVANCTGLIATCSNVKVPIMPVLSAVLQQRILQERVARTTQLRRLC
jgi:hypothetical protein